MRPGYSSHCLQKGEARRSWRCQVYQSQGRNESSSRISGKSIGVGSSTIPRRTSAWVIFFSELQFVVYQIRFSNLIVALSMPMAAARVNQDGDSVLKAEKQKVQCRHQCPCGLSPVDPLPSSPAQEALDLLFCCDSTEEASSSPARGPLSEAELALFDPYSKEGKTQVWGRGRGAWRVKGEPPRL